MNYEDLNSYKRLDLGDVVRIRDKYLPPNCSSLGIAPVPSPFLDYVKDNGNEFTIRSIGKFDDDIFFEFWELHGVLYYGQIEPLTFSRVVNCHKKK
jgi:hypothetical protein